MPLPHDALVLVADGRKMLFFRNHGDENQIDLRTAQRMIAGNCPKASSCNWSGGSGASEAPNVTVPALICAIPPPDPIDW